VVLGFEERGFDDAEVVRLLLGNHGVRLVGEPAPFVGNSNPAEVLKHLSSTIVSGRALAIWCFWFWLRTWACFTVLLAP